MITTIALLEAEVARRIAAISTTGKTYAQGADAWRESTVPLTATRDASLYSHLCFSVSLESAPVGMSQHHAGDTVGVLEGLLAVVFLARIRPGSGQAQADARLASDAARDVLGVVLAQHPDVDFAPRDVYRPGPIVDGFLSVRLDFLVSFDLSISPIQAA